MQHCRIGADEVMGLLSGAEETNALIAGHYDESGRHQPWGIIYCTHRHTHAWSAAGHAYGAAFDWISKHHDILREVCKDEWPFSRRHNEVRTIASCSAQRKRQETLFGDMIVTHAFPKVSFGNDEKRAFGHQEGDHLRFEMIRDGGTSIDGFFNTWPPIFEKQVSVMCHHHDAPIMKKKAKEIMRLFLNGTWTSRQHNSMKKGGRKEPLPKAVQRFWDKEVKRSKTGKNVDRTHYYDDLWHTYFNGMYDAWCHTPSKERRNALIDTTCEAMVDMGMGEIAKIVVDRYRKGSHKLGKMTRSDMAVPRGPLANAGCEGGPNKRVQKYIGLVMSIGNVLQESIPWLVEEGITEWNRPGPLLVADVTNAGKTENNNPWLSRRGADSTHAWADARRLLNKYFGGKGTTTEHWKGVHTEGKNGVICVASQEVRDFCARKAFRELLQTSDERHDPELAFETLLGSEDHHNLVMQQHKDVYSCWKSYRHKPMEFLGKIKQDCFNRSEGQSQDYWANDRLRKTSRVTDWLEIFQEALFYERAYCRCEPTSQPMSEDDKSDKMPERWRLKDKNLKPIDFLTFKCDCLMFQMHGFCGSVLACGLHAGHFDVPLTKDGTPMGGKMEKDYNDRYNVTPAKAKSQYWIRAGENKHRRVYRF